MQEPKDDLRKCPFCAELIKKAAVLCKYCHSEIPSENQSSHEDIQQPKDRSLLSVEEPKKYSSSSNKPVLWFVTVGIIIFVVAGWMAGLIATITSFHKSVKHDLLSATAPTQSANSSGTALSSGDGATNSNALIDQIIQAQKVGDDDADSAAFQSLYVIPKSMPGNSVEATRLNKLGLKDLNSKNYTEAVTFFGLASKADPSDPKYLSNLGFAEMNAGNLDAAKQHLYSSIAIAPTRSIAWGDLGLVFAKQGDQDKSVACFLLGYKVSGGDSLGFLKTLQSDDDPAVRNAGSMALNKVQTTQAASQLPNGAVDSAYPSIRPSLAPPSHIGGSTFSNFAPSATPSPVSIDASDGTPATGEQAPTAVGAPSVPQSSGANDP